MPNPTTEEPKQRWHWECDPNSPSEYLVDDRLGIILCHDKYFGDYPAPVCIAHKRRIAALPQLLAACRSIFRELDDRYDRCEDSTTLWMGEFLEQLSTAIQTAEQPEDLKENKP